MMEQKANYGIDSWQVRFEEYKHVVCPKIELYSNATRQMRIATYGHGLASLAGALYLLEKFQAPQYALLVVLYAIVSNVVLFAMQRYYWTALNASLATARDCEVALGLQVRTWTAHGTMRDSMLNLISRGLINLGPFGVVTVTFIVVLAMICLR